MSQNFRLDWKGEGVLEDVAKASIAASDEALEDAADRARGSHPSWTDRSGETARSIKVIRRAAAQGERIVGSLGSRMAHFIFLEIGHHGRRGDRTISRALKQEGAALDERIAKKLRYS